VQPCENSSTVQIHAGGIGDIACKDTIMGSKANKAGKVKAQKAPRQAIKRERSSDEVSCPAQTKSITRASARHKILAEPSSVKQRDIRSPSSRSRVSSVKGDVILARVTESGRKEDAHRLRKIIALDQDYEKSPSAPETLRMSTRRSSRNVRS